ncbi:MULTISPECIES: heme-binding protein [unclassified Guyparkeria]|uniref:GlcG/HbpS family heme-binding protein n=1 Tax=unclassified Guyparkeria TaxID=2626246 RepID=UPI0007333AFB|nr:MULTISPECIES: heme-binding protein [unclassified Guyparkeria]KTG17596.1 adenosylcobalamin biosynthesis, GlcG-related protein [Guyparkeria sp. XI15]OAE88409.1 adenosylcobalamin biosynthesis, GlcG-related protein [Guyparkeria sp. WRN-7]
MKAITRTLKQTAIGASLALASTTGLAASDQPATISVERLSMEMALKAAQGAVEACREEGIQIGVTVVDRGGNPQVVLRDVLAPDLTLRISKMKAYTALSFNTATSTLEERGQGALGNVPGLMMGAGAVTIEAGGKIYGAIGVSGAPSGDTDEMCASKGAEAVAMELEFL